MQDVPRQATATETTERNGGRASRRDEILRIAMGLFARNGFDGTSIRDIADAAGLTKPALYYHFSDKEELYEHVVTERMTRLNAAMREAIAGSDDPVEQVRLFVLAHARRMDADRTGWITARHSFHSITDPERRERIGRMRREFEHMLRDRFQDAMDRGLLSSEVSATLVTRMLLSAVNDLARWMRTDGGMTAEDAARAYLDVTLRGMSARD